MPFCMDGVALAALIIGTKSAGDEGVAKKTGEWVRRCRDATAGGKGLADWEEWLLAEILRALRFGLGPPGWRWPRSRRGPAGIVLPRNRCKCPGLGHRGDEAEVLNLIRKPLSAGIGVYRAAIRLAALDWVRRDRPLCDLRTVTVEAIGDLLRRIPSGLKKWTWETAPRTARSTEARQWHVENEYHVQNMLWFLLAPLLPDLDDEDSTPKVGPVQPRADIVIPSLRLIVEAKFLRASDAPKKMVEQIAQDAGLYLVAGSKYDKMIPFIWDDSRRTEYHEEMIRGLRQIAGVVDAVIVPRPGRMVLPSGTGAARKPGGTKKMKNTPNN